MSELSTYSGHVTPSGPATTRVLDEITITKFSVGHMDNNVYLLVCRNTHDAVLIDAANEAGHIQGVIEGHPDVPTLRGIITTHRHQDHWRALAEVAGARNVTLYAGADDAAELPVDVDVPVEHGNTIELGHSSLGVIGLRGHTPGSIAIVYRDPHGSEHLFTGDSLFPGGPGKTTSTEDFTSLMEDLEAHVFDIFDDSAWVYPGHGDDTTIGAERPHLGEWRERGW